MLFSYSGTFQKCIETYCILHASIYFRVVNICIYDKKKCVEFHSLRALQHFPAFLLLIVWDYVFLFFCLYIFIYILVVVLLLLLECSHTSISIDRLLV